jgi:hypothetical protein
VLKFNTLVIANVAKKVNSSHVSKCRVFCSVRIISNSLLELHAIMVDRSHKGARLTCPNIITIRSILKKKKMVQVKTKRRRLGGGGGG